MNANDAPKIASASTASSEPASSDTSKASYSPFGAKPKAVPVQGYFATMGNSAVSHSAPKASFQATVASTSAVSSVGSQPKPASYSPFSSNAKKASFSPFGQKPKAVRVTGYLAAL
jgi:hypothetical protein